MTLDNEGYMGASFKDKLLNMLAKAKRKSVLMEDDVIVLLDDVLSNFVEAILSIKLSKRVHILMEWSMAKTMIVVVIGRNISFNALLFETYGI
ncbi:hypothetical protein PVK06_011851 [Gossypium arboreum]|uniref:Uncharacterized protein n=1 Tax=Gossypium arboreum TaxID=29729 RepID=A0ABR0QAK8_GOSAR|nr:hypothetical protein PVK06_011851 [Gossypium arboreum]